MPYAKPAFRTKDKPCSYIYPAIRQKLQLSSKSAKIKKTDLLRQKPLRGMSFGEDVGSREAAYTGSSSQVKIQLVARICRTLSATAAPSIWC